MDTAILLLLGTAILTMFTVLDYRYPEGNPMFRELLFILGLMVAAFILVLASSAMAEEMKGQVYWFADGDSFKFKTRRLNAVIEDECRMLYYNAPEMNEKGSPSGRDAKEQLQKIIGDRDIIIKASHTDRDKYGRLLCEAWLEDGTNVNKAMRTWLEQEGYKDVGKYDNLGAPPWKEQ